MTKKPNPSEIFKERLKTAREDLRKWSQSELAGRAKLPPSSIAHFEAGSRKPSFDTLRTPRQCAGGDDRLPARPRR